MQSNSLLLVGHGTRDPDGIAEMRGLLERMRAALPEHQVEVGLLEFPTVGLPSLGDAVTRCLETGVLSLGVLPLLLHQADQRRGLLGHVRMTSVVPARFANRRWACSTSTSIRFG